MTAGWHLVTLKPDASCIPDTLFFNLLRAVLDFAVLCATPSLAVTLRDRPLLRQQNWSAGLFRAALSTRTVGPVCLLARWDWRRTSLFFFTGGQAKLPGSIIETLIKVLCVLFCAHNDRLSASEEQVPGHVFTTFHSAERLWGGRRESSSRDITLVPPTNGSSALEEHSCGDYVWFANNKLS